MSRSVRCWAALFAVATIVNAYSLIDPQNVSTGWPWRAASVIALLACFNAVRDLVKRKPKAAKRVPVELSAEMRQAATATRQLYAAYRDQGFTEAEARDFTKHTIATATHGGNA